MSYVKNLECSSCHKEYEAGKLHGLCTACGLPLIVNYQLDALKASWDRTVLQGRPTTMWRYQEALPVARAENIVSLGEGFTPVLRLDRLGRALGLGHLYVKDESFNPTGSFKARGLAAAVSMAKELGVKKVAIPSAGNAAGAMAAYAAKAGLEAFIFMPEDAPQANKVEAEIYGAHVTLVKGLITDAAKAMAQKKDQEGWFDVSTLKEPYRIEGKKTMGYELAEQFDWSLPDVILYPTGGGTGLIGMWKAFDEMEKMGWIGAHRPRMVSVQAEGCAPIVRAFEQGVTKAPEWQGAKTVAAGLRVPKAIGDFLIINALRASRGAAVAVPDGQILEDVKQLGAQEGIFAAPEGAACLSALKVLLQRKFLDPEEKIVLFNTGSGLKYIDVL
jgi:threonine synthase